MTLDYSIDYDTSHEEFVGQKVLEIMQGPLWITMHTETGSNFMYDTFGLSMPINKSMKFNYTYGNIVRKKLSEANLSGTYGGFHYKNILH